MAYDTISTGQCPLCGRSGSIALTWAHSWDQPLRGKDGSFDVEWPLSLTPCALVSGTLHHRNTRQGDHLKVSCVEEAIPPYTSPPQGRCFLLLPFR